MWFSLVLVLETFQWPDNSWNLPRITSVSSMVPEQFLQTWSLTTCFFPTTKINLYVTSFVSNFLVCYERSVDKSHVAWKKYKLIASGVTCSDFTSTNRCCWRLETLGCVSMLPPTQKSERCPKSHVRLETWLVRVQYFTSLSRKVHATIIASLPNAYPRIKFTKLCRPRSRERVM